MANYRYALISLTEFQKFDSRLVIYNRVKLWPNVGKTGFVTVQYVFTSEIPDSF